MLQLNKQVDTAVDHAIYFSHVHYYYILLLDKVSILLVRANLFGMRIKKMCVMMGKQGWE